MDSNNKIIVPLLIVLLIIVFMIPLGSFVINFENFESENQLNTPIAELDNQSLAFTFDFDNDFRFSALNEKSLNEIFQDNELTIDYTYPMGNKVHNATRGKNLFSKDSAIQGYYISETTGEVLPSALYYASDWIIVEPSTTYRVSGNDNNLRFAIYDSEKNYISGGLNNSIVTPSNGTYVRVTIGWTLSDDKLNTYQLEQGTVATTYEAYYHDNYYGNVQWEIGLISDDDTTQRFGVDFNNVLQSATSWTPQNELTNTIEFRRPISSLDIKEPVNNTVAVVGRLTINGDVFSAEAINTQATTDVESFGYHTTIDQIIIRIDKSKLTGITSADFEAYLQANDVLFVYELDTYITEDIPRYYYSHDDNYLYDITTPLGFDNTYTVDDLDLLHQYYLDGIYNADVFMLLYDYGLSQKEWDYYHTLFVYYNSL